MEFLSSRERRKKINQILYNTPPKKWYHFFRENNEDKKQVLFLTLAPQDEFPLHLFQSGTYIILVLIIDYASLLMFLNLCGQKPPPKTQILAGTQVRFPPCSIISKYFAWENISISSSFFFFLWRGVMYSYWRNFVPYGPTYMFFLPVFTVYFALFSHFFLFCCWCTHSDPTTTRFVPFSCRIVTPTILCLNVIESNRGMVIFP